MVIPKIDAHVHAALNRIEKGPNSFPQPDCGELREFLMQQGAVSAILMIGNPDDPNTGAAAARRMVERYPGFYYSACNITGQEPPEAVYDILAEAKELGAVSVGEFMINDWISNPLITAAFAAAEKLELPVTFHMSPEPGYSYGICDRPGLPLLEEALRSFPRLILLGHSQAFWIEISGDAPTEGNEARSCAGSGPVVPGGAVIRLMEQYPNLYGDLSAMSGFRAITRDERFGLQFLETYQDRLLYASDTIGTMRPMPLAAYLDECTADGRISAAVSEKICVGNAKRVFRI